mmetsp:Transcript_105578/g.158043  ORF Transcript_105578/g.158043 Transcript_105578/m.158043 type:complete len:247 (-) Transcript_105578:9-749(-)
MSSGSSFHNSNIFHHMPSIWLLLRFLLLYSCLVPAIVVSAIDCGCPDTCTAEALAEKNGARFTCLARITTLMERTQLPELDACRHASLRAEEIAGGANGHKACRFETCHPMGCGGKTGGSSVSSASTTTAGSPPKKEDPTSTTATTTSQKDASSSSSSFVLSHLATGQAVSYAEAVGVLGLLGWLLHRVWVSKKKSKQEKAEATTKERRHTLNNNKNNNSKNTTRSTRVSKFARMRRARPEKTGWW